MYGVYLTNQCVESYAIIKIWMSYENTRYSELKFQIFYPRTKIMLMTKIEKAAYVNLLESENILLVDSDWQRML